VNYLLVHGAGEGPSVWAGWDGVAIDLQAGLVVPEISMLNYEAVVACEAGLIPRPLCVVGRGMGALAARMAARRIEPDRLVFLDPWPPMAEPAGMRPESQLALEECRRGVHVPEPAAPTLLLEGKIDPAEVAQWAR
jgi:pimeloyl-ACP methyl ester carboxylesterase